MRIWIDGFEANVEQRVGSGQVAFELLGNFERLDMENDYTILLASFPVHDLPKERKGWRYKILKVKRLKTLLGLPVEYYSSSNKPDIIFSPTHYIPRFIKAKRIGTIFDLSYLHFPQMFLKKDLYKLKNWTEYTIKNADHLITISEFTKQDIIKHYKIKEEKITVAYPGYDESMFKPQRDKEKLERLKENFKIPDNYIIYIGTLQPRKNLIKLIEAFSLVARVESQELRGGNLKLVIIGKTKGPGREGWMYDEILEAPKKFGIEDKVVFTGYLETENVVTLLNGAKAFVLPSLWEGFGIPAVEAMSCGIPVIVSNVSSLPEIVGKAGLLIDPNNETAIKQAIEMILDHKPIADKLSVEGLEQSKKFSWEKMAKKVLEIFK